MHSRCIMIFPEFVNIAIIEEIRKKYDPLAYNVRPHITLVFPFISDIEYNRLKKHVEEALLSFPPFNIELKGITPSRINGNYIFLNLKEGQEEIIEIHKKLYTGILEVYRPQWLKNTRYIPHMTVGSIEAEERYSQALEEVKTMDKSFRALINKISVEIIEENQDSSIEMEIALRAQRQSSRG